MAFDEGIRKTRQLARGVELNVLIWGPGASGGEHYDKRKKMLEVVKATFPNSDVRFSEDPELAKSIPHAVMLSTPEQEAWHLASSDLCVVLDTAKGAGEEIAHFTGSKEAYKLLICTDKKYEHVNSFPAELRKYGVQIFYTEEEYRLCSLVERVIARLDQRALGSLLGFRA